jgi:hypothetical protein
MFLKPVLKDILEGAKDYLHNLAAVLISGTRKRSKKQTEKCNKEKNVTFAI